MLFKLLLGTYLHSVISSFAVSIAADNKRHLGRKRFLTSQKLLPLFEIGFLNLFTLNKFFLIKQALRLQF